MSNDQLLFVKVVSETNQSNLEILYIMYRTNIPYNDYKTTIPDREKIPDPERVLVAASSGLCVESQMFKLNLRK